MVMLAPMYDSERYECPSCEVQVLDPQSTQSRWKCGSCGTFIFAYVEDHLGTRRVLERVPASDLSKGDLVALRGSPLSEAHEVLAVDYSGPTSMRIAFKGYRAINVSPENEFNRLQSAW